MLKSLVKKHSIHMSHNMLQDCPTILKKISQRNQWPRENCRKQMVSTAYFWCGICGCFCASTLDCTYSKRINMCRKKENNKIRTKLSAQTHLLITELLIDINHTVWGVVWLIVCMTVCLCVREHTVARVSVKAYLMLSECCKAWKPIGQTNPKRFT